MDAELAATLRRDAPVGARPEVTGGDSLPWRSSPSSASAAHRQGATKPAPRKLAPLDDESRFRNLYLCHYRGVLAYALRRSMQTSDAHDVVAETFLVAWRRLDKVPEGPEARAWLMGVARGVLANQRRGWHRRNRLRGRLQFEAESVEDPTPATVINDKYRLAVTALGRLKADDQEVLRLVAWEGLSHREVAQVLGCSENAVAIRIHRSRKRLAEEIASEQLSAEEGDQRDRRPTDGGVHD